MTRIGMIGTGNFARQHAEILEKLNCKIVGCHGTNKDKTFAFSNEFNCKIFENPVDLISPHAIDVLYIAIPPFAHNGNVENHAIKQKIPFLCEKPVGLDLSTCKKIADKILETNLITSSGYLLRYEPLLNHVKKIIQRNKISAIRICSYSYMPEVHWWRKKELSGGMMVESGTHYIDLLRYLFGEITSVASIASKGFADKNIADCNLDDSMEAILKFQSGMIASIGVTHLLNKINARNDELLVYGEDFALKIDLYKLRYKNEATVLYKEVNDKEWITLSNPTSKQLLLEYETSAFINAIKANCPSLIKSTYPDGVKSLEVALAMNQSAEEQHFIEILS